MWIKPNGEMPFLYGNHVLKAHLGRITEDTPEHQGVVVFSMNDIPLVCFSSVQINDLVIDFLAQGLRGNSAINGRYTKT